jgi:hypothetical protein
MKLQLSHSKVLFALFFSLFIAIGPGCKRGERMKIDPAFAKYIAAFTGGTISAAGNIRVCLTQAFNNVLELNTPLDNNLFSFSPDIPGKMVWVDNQTVEFRPEKWLERGELYRATFDLSKLTQVTGKLKTFKFDFGVLNQQMTVDISSVKPYGVFDREKCRIEGELRVMDVCDETALKNTISASQNGDALPVNVYATGNPNVFNFSVDSILRTELAQTVVINVNGDPIDADFKQSINQRIPSINEFSVLLTQVVQQPEQYVKLVFSDPLLPEQKLNGLITISGLSNWEKLNFTIDGNEVLVYPPNRISGNRKLMVYAGIKGMDNQAITNVQEFDLKFEDAVPAVRLSDSKKVILPPTDGMVMPFEAVNLSAVDVRVIQLFESNVPQFLQVNDLDGNREMKRVGRTVKRTTVQLNTDGKKNLAEWNTFFLDLNTIMKAEKGAIYRVEISFRKVHSLYNCPGSETASLNDVQEEIEANEDEADDQLSYWDYYDDYYYDGYDDDYNWRERDNPCSNSYYNSERTVAKNLLASDLGIIAKQGSDGRVYVAVSDIRTTNPIEGVEVEILNYQQQAITKMVTANDGTCTYDGKGNSKPYLIVAKRGGERGYLKVDGGKALSVSKFDVSGAESSKGLKGMIYGERGVWRPGDTLFLSFHARR